METIIQLFERLHWWQRPLVAVLPLLLAALVLPALYTSLVRIPLDVLRKQYPQDDQRKGLEHIGYGAGIFAVAGVFRKACIADQGPLDHAHASPHGMVSARCRSQGKTAIKSCC